MIKQRFKVDGMSCAACQNAVEKTVAKLDGVDEVSVNLMTGLMDVTYDEAKLDSVTISQEVTDVGYSASLIEDESKKN
jgi:Cu+-exporting ATPase